MYITMERVKLSDETIEKVDELKKFFKGREEHNPLDDVTDYQHRLDNKRFDRDYMIRRVVEDFLEEVGIE